MLVKGITSVCELLVQWFLTFFTYLTLSSNKITKFTPNGDHLLKMRN